VFLFRLADRAFLALLFQEPPRSTRFPQFPKLSKRELILDSNTFHGRSIAICHRDRKTPKKNSRAGQMPVDQDKEGKKRKETYRVLTPHD
jgi:hypothetical protein